MENNLLVIFYIALELLEAWEQGENKRFIPKGEGIPAPRLERLTAHVKKTLAEMAEELRRGSIAADPSFQSRSENACAFCDFKGACRFADGENGESYQLKPKLRDKQVWELLEGGKADE